MAQYDFSPRVLPQNYQQAPNPFLLALNQGLGAYNAEKTGQEELAMKKRALDLQTANMASEQQYRTYQQGSDLRRTDRENRTEGIMRDNWGDAQSPVDSARRDQARAAIAAVVPTMAPAFTRQESPPPRPEVQTEWQKKGYPSLEAEQAAEVDLAGKKAGAEAKARKPYERDRAADEGAVTAADERAQRAADRVAMQHVAAAGGDVNKAIMSMAGDKHAEALMNAGALDRSHVEAAAATYKQNHEARVTAVTAGGTVSGRAGDVASFKSGRQPPGRTPGSAMAPADASSTPADPDKTLPGRWNSLSDPERVREITRIRAGLGSKLGRPATNEELKTELLRLGVK
jgi:hypothetical protein